MLASGCTLLRTSDSDVSPAFVLGVGMADSDRPYRTVHVLDASGRIGDARAATSAEMDLSVEGTGDATLRLVADGNVLVRWLGPACPGTTTLSVEPGGDVIAVADAHDDGCDAAGAMYGVVLDYDDDRDPARIVVRYLTP
jgi:hypothetical protein